MAENIIRKDVISLSFDIDNAPLQQLTKELNSVKKVLSNAFGDDVFEDMADDAEKAKKPIEEIGDSAKKAKKPLEDLPDPLKDTEKQGEKAHKPLKKIADLNFDKVTSGLKKVGSVAGKVAVKAAKISLAGVGATAAGIGKIAYDATQAFGEYEQLKGGMEKIFDKADMKGIMADANDAYKNLGLSANDYLRVINDTGANFASTMGDQKGYETAKTGLTAISDYASGTGKSVDVLSEKFAMITRASSSYQSIADQFSGILPATSADFLKQAKAAGFLENKYTKLTDVPIAEYQGAVSKMLEKGVADLGLAGNTAFEAEKTFSGSLGMMKASWGNLLTAIGSGEGLDQCFDNMMHSAEVFGGQLIPILERSLGGIGIVVEKLVPKISEKLPALAEDLLPPLIKSAVSLASGLVKALPSIVKTVFTTLVDITKDQFPMLGKMFSGLADASGTIAKFIPYALGLAGALMAFTKVKSAVSIVSGLFGGKEAGGGKGKGKKKSIFDSLAKMNPKTILKAMANIGIIVGGLTIMTAGLMALAPYMAKLSDGKSLVEVISVMAALGVVGGVATKFAGVAGKIPILTVVKGLANMAIMVGGLTALTAAFMLVAPYIAKLSDSKSVFEVISIMSVLGTVGGVLSIFAGIVGMIPIPVVLAGLANIALVIGGLSALVVAFGALGEIPGFNEFITKGGEVLANLFGQIGKIAGSLVGGLGEGLTASLPAIGENLTGFVDALKPAFETMKDVDMAGVGTFFSSLAGFLLKLTANDLLSFFTGGNDFQGIADGLKILSGTEVTGFFAAMQTVEDEGFSKAKKFFNSLGEIGNIPNKGGIGQWFSGTNDYAGLASGLKKLSGKNVTGFYAAMQTIKKEAFNKAKLFFQSLSDIGNIPNTGGAGQWFSGENDYGALANGLKKLSNKSVIGFFTAIQDIKASAFSNTKALFKCIVSAEDATEVELGGLYNKGIALSNFAKKVQPFITQIQTWGAVNFGVVNKLWGIIKTASGVVNLKLGGLYKKGVALTNFMIQAKGFFQHAASVADLTGSADNVINSLKKFFSTVNNITTSKLPDLKNEFQKTMKGIEQIMDASIKRLISQVTALPKKMGSGLRSTGGALSSALVSIWQNAVKAVSVPINKLISGANWVMKQFGSNKTIASWTPYANGTNGHKGGNALVNDGRGAELVQMPNGQTYLPQGKNVFIPNAPKGMKVLPAEQTAQLMGRKRPTYRYAKGTGEFDVFQYADDPAGLVKKIKDTYVSYDGMSGIALELGKGMVSLVTGEMKSWAKKLIDEFGVLSLANYNPSKGVAQWRNTVKRALMMEGLYSEANVALTLFQMQTESGGNPFAINLWDSNAKKGVPSKGLMQVIDPTFAAYARPGFNTNIYDPLSNILASIRYAVARYGSLANAFRGVGYANGGLVTKTGMIAENPRHPEWVIPTDPNKRGRALSLYRQAGNSLGLSKYSPEDSVYSSKRGEATEYNTYSPQFNLTISGTSDDRATARKVKKWVKEAMEETFESMGRRNPKLQTI